MSNYSEYLVSKYQSDLFYNLLRKGNVVNLFPFNEDTEFNSFDLDFFRDMRDSLFFHLEEINKPIYKSRQDFLRNVFLDENKKLCFHLETSGESSTCMGGSQESDPFYDPNWKKTSYDINSRHIKKITKNLKSRFFFDINFSFDEFSNFNSKEFYTLSISLENISIEYFNELFTPKKGSIDKNKVEAFLNEIIIFEKIEEKTSEKVNETKKEDLIPKHFKDAQYAYMKSYVDESGNYMSSEPVNASHHSVIQVGDILTFKRGEQRIVTDIKLMYSPLTRFKLDIHTKIKKYNQNDFLII